MLAVRAPAPAEYRRRTPEREPLYKALAGHLETFLAQHRAQDQPLPRYIEQDLHAYLACGVLAYGFVRVRCTTCGESRLVAFSCKKRGFCPSCLGRRMADTAAHLVDHVLPHVPVRQWVLSLPYELRYRLAWDGPLLGAVLAVFLRVVAGWYRAQARRQGHPAGRSGAVTFVQRFDSSPPSPTPTPAAPTSTTSAATPGRHPSPRPDSTPSPTSTSPLEA